MNESDNVLIKICRKLNEDLKTKLIYFSLAACGHFSPQVSPNHLINYLCLHHFLRIDLAFPSHMNWNPLWMTIVLWFQVTYVPSQVNACYAIRYWFPLEQAQFGNNHEKVYYCTRLFHLNTGRIWLQIVLQILIISRLIVHITYQTPAYSLDQSEREVY